MYDLYSVTDCVVQNVRSIHAFSSVVIPECSCIFNRKLERKCSCILTTLRHLYSDKLRRVIISADITAACDELLSAIHALRTLPDEEPAVNVENGATTPTPQNAATTPHHETARKTAGVGRRLRPPNELVRIDGLVQYAAELNRSQGLCFTMRQRRVTPGMVCSSF
jgi:hypothetical protein